MHKQTAYLIIKLQKNNKQTNFTIMEKNIMVSLNDWDGKEYEFQMTTADALACSHSGDCYNDCVEVAQLEYMQAQLSNLSDEQIKNILSNYGVDYADDETRSELEILLVWIIAGEVHCYILSEN